MTFRESITYFEPPDDDGYGVDPYADVVVDGANFGMPGWSARRYHCTGYSAAMDAEVTYGWRWEVVPPPELDGLDLVDVKAWSHIQQLVRFLNAVNAKAEQIEMEEQP